MAKNIKNRALFGIAGLAAFLSACATHQEEAALQEDMTIDVNFRDVHLCSRISPEITVAYAPAGTKFYDVRLLEEGNQTRYLGGGRWTNDGSGLIPEGALTRHYSGPCPPENREIEYIYVVSAMESEQGQPLEVRLYRFKPERP